MKYAEINQAFTTAVSEKIAQGYTICTNTMGGTQGEIAFVNFHKDGKFYSLYLDREHHYEDHNYLELYVMRWVVSTELENENLGFRDFTMWRGERHSTTLEETLWYKVDRDDWFVTEEEAKVISAKIKARWHHERGTRTEKYQVKITKATAKVLASLYKRNKRRSDRALAAKDILSAHVTHFINGSRELCLVPAAGNGALVSVSLHFARG